MHITDPYHLNNCQRLGKEVCFLAGGVIEFRSSQTLQLLQLYFNRCFLWI